MHRCAGELALLHVPPFPLYRVRMRVRVRASVSRLKRVKPAEGRFGKEQELEPRADVGCLPVRGRGERAGNRFVPGCGVELVCALTARRLQLRLAWSGREHRRATRPLSGGLRRGGARGSLQRV